MKNFIAFYFALLLLSSMYISCQEQLDPQSLKYAELMKNPEVESIDWMVQLDEDRIVKLKDKRKLIIENKLNESDSLCIMKTSISMFNNRNEMVYYEQQDWHIVDVDTVVDNSMVRQFNDGLKEVVKNELYCLPIKSFTIWQINYYD